MSDLVVSFTITPLTPLTVLNVALPSGSLTTQPVATQTGLTTGNFQFYHVKDGWFSALQYVGNRFRRVGQAGSGMQTLGSASPDTSFTAAAAFINDSDALAFIAGIEALPTVVCSVKDAWGRTVPRVRFTTAIARPRRTRGGTVSGIQSTSRVECVLAGERLSDA